MPKVLHVILLAALRSLLSKWRDPSPPSMTEVLSQVKHYLNMDKLEVLRNKNMQAKSFFKKWKPFLLAFLDADEIQQLMLPFRNTSWYLTSDLAGSLGRLRLQIQEDQ